MRPRSITRRTAMGILVLAAACAPSPEALENNPADPGPVPPDMWQVEVLATTPHDPTAFTQGLEVFGDVIIESTGQYGESSIRKVDPATGTVEAESRLGDALFGEGLTVVDGRIIQLTWKEGRALVWDAAELAVVDEFAYEGEGWGLCWTGEELAMSDGSSTLQFRAAADFSLLRTVVVTANGSPVSQLNELECTEGRVLANVLETDTVVMIDPDTGRVTAQIDLSPLRDELTQDQAQGINHLNGIAAIPGGETYFVTGKLWPEIYEVRFVPAPATP